MFFHLGTADNPVGAPFRQRVKAAASTNATLIKASPGNVYAFLFAAPAAAAAAAFVKFYDKASAPVVGTDVPVATIPVVSSTTYAGLVELKLPAGLRFDVGIAFAITGLVGDADATAVAADAVHGFILWK
jgi:hypothetical protein